MKRRQIGIHFTYGLPASGKTTFANDSRNHGGRTTVIDFDAICNKYKTQTIPSAKKSAIFKNLRNQITAFGSTDCIIIDGLFTTNAQVKEVIDYLNIELGDSYDLFYGIYWWPEDRENCLKNDIGRRGESSVTSINNLPFEKPNASVLGIPEKRITKQRVFARSDAQVWAIKLQLGEQMILKSKSWCNGGTWGSWDGSEGTVDAEPPIEFSEFDELLGKICPDISFLNYKNIKNKCVTLKTVDDNDYYGGSTSRSYHECDLNKLYDELKSRDLIKE